MQMHIRMNQYMNVENEDALKLVANHLTMSMHDKLLNNRFLIIKYSIQLVLNRIIYITTRISLISLIKNNEGTRHAQKQRDSFISI